MTKSKAYDAVIIGTGQGGKPLALALAEKGLKVAVIEKRFVGGTCINYGCTPTKTMIASAEIAYKISESTKYGVSAGKVKVDLKKIMERKDGIVKEFRDGSEKALKDNKNIELIFGTASFISKYEIIIKLKNGTTKNITSNKIFINTGAIPFIPNIKGIEKIEYLTSESIMELQKIPEHLIVIGGSYIGLEFGQMFRRFGSKVTIVEKNERIISKEDKDISDELTKILTEEGIKIYCSHETNEISKTSDSKIRVILKKGKVKKTISGSHILFAVGIKPNTADLKLSSAGINITEKGYIRVNDKLETNVKNIYALGDANGGPAFTHVSYDDYRIIFENLFAKKKRTTAKRLIPYTLFTDPQLGRVGITENEAKEKKLNYLKAVLPMKNVARAYETGNSKGFMKAIIDAKTKKILGCAVLGMEGGEIMAMIQIAMMNNVPYTKLQEGIFSHPTLAESLNNLFSKIDL